MGTVRASELIRSLQRGGRASTLGRAIGEVGRIPKTLHLLNFIADPNYRRHILNQLNRGEGPVTVQNVDTDVGKSQLANMLARKEPGPGYVHLPCGVHGEVAGGWDIEAVAELTAEYRREQNVCGYTVTRWYKRASRANHRLDCFLYALAALAMSRLKIDECALQRTEAKNVGEEPEKKEQPVIWGVQPARAADPYIQTLQREQRVHREQSGMRWGVQNRG